MHQMGSNRLVLALSPLNDEKCVFLKFKGTKKKNKQNLDICINFDCLNHAQVDSSTSVGKKKSA